MILLTFLGPENLGRNFDVAHDEDMQTAAGDEALERAHIPHHHHVEHEVVHNKEVDV